MFIVIEGMDGAGSSTQRSRLATYLRELRSEPCDVCETAEPSSGPIGKYLREILREGSAPDVSSFSNHTLALLFAADRQYHYENEIAPFLSTQSTKQRVVISDRYDYSTIVYQGGGDNLLTDWIHDTNHFVGRPDLVFFLDIDPETAINRIYSDPSRKTFDIYERKDFLKNLRSRYKKVFERVASQHSEKVIIIDASEEIEVVHKNIIQAFETFFKESLSKTERS